MARIGSASLPGFTVIELMIVIAITGIVGALVFSAYRTYSTRAEVVDGIEKAIPATTAVAAVFKTSGEPPEDPAAAGLETDKLPASDYVSSMDVSNGRIDITYGGRASPAIAGRTLSLTPYETAGLKVVWICGNEIPGPGLKPLGFVGGGRQAQQIPTTIEARYLPSTCR